MTGLRAGGGNKRLRRLRHRAYEILEHGRHEDRVARGVHATLILIIVLSVLVAVLETVPSLADRFNMLFRGLESVALAVFTIEFAARLWAAAEYPPFRHLTPWRARWAYTLTVPALIDLLTLVPLYAALIVGDDLRALAIFRLVRFLKLARYSPGLHSLFEAVYSERRALVGCLVIIGALTIGTAAMMHLAETHAQPDKFGTIPDAMWWAIVTLTTVGYGDVVPVTPIGKIIAGLTAVMGIVMLALPVGIIATAFAEVIHRREFVVTWGMVSRVPLFEDLKAEEVAQITKLLRSQSVEAGEVIVRRGEIGHSMYFIATGQVEIEAAHGRRHQLGQGQFFGEIAVLRSTRRSATVRASVRTQLLVLDAADLRTLMTTRPDIGERIHAIAKSRMSGTATVLHTPDDDSAAEPDG